MQACSSFKYCLLAIIVMMNLLNGINKLPIYLQTVKNKSYLIFICDMITRNESDVGDVVFEILAKTVFKFLYFILFLALTNR